jgi:hypothetical protein
VLLGGHAHIELLEYLNPTLIRKNPKILLGTATRRVYSLQFLKKLASSPLRVPPALPLVNPHFPYSDNPWYLGDPNHARMYFKKTPGWQVLRKGKRPGTF